MKKKVVIIGHFGGNENFTDGQTVKTKVLYEELSSQTDWRIGRVDTYYKSKCPIILLVQVIVALVSSKDIILLVSRNGMRFFFPLLYWANKLVKTRIYHDVIGGNLHTYIQANQKFKKYLNSFTVNWVETNYIKKNVEKCGVRNCVVIPNFKRLETLSEDSIRMNFVYPIRFCTFSRVMLEKGIENAITAIEEINSVAKRQICSLDIYGQIEDNYKDRFECLMSKTTKAVEYKGVVAFGNSVNVLEEYSALLFPTFWDGEGFPGTIIDAYSAGLPVIATDWNSNKELIQSGITGIVYSLEDEGGLRKSIEQFLEYSIDDRTKMKKNCLMAAQNYKPEIWVDEMIRFIIVEGKKAK